MMQVNENHLNPFVAGVVSACCIVAATKFSVDQKFFLAFTSMIFLSMFLYTIRPFCLFLKFSLVVAFPVIAIHSILNANYPITWTYYGLTFRAEGCAFGLKISSNILTLICAAIAWYSISRDRFVDTLIYIRFPMWLVLVTALAISIFNQIPRHTKNILLAQQSRGLSNGPSIVRKLKSLVFVILPLISRLLNEVDGRSLCLVSRGFASQSMTCPKVRFFTKRDLIHTFAFTALTTTLLVL